MPSRNLPPSPNLTHLKSQAKQLLQAARAGDDDARARFAAALPRFDRHSPAPDVLALADALSVIAREYGYDSWPKLKRHVEALTATEALAAGDVRAFGDLLSDNPDLQDHLRRTRQRNCQFFGRMRDELDAPLAALAAELAALLDEATGAQAASLRQLHAAVAQLALRLKDLLALAASPLDEFFSALGDDAQLNSLLQRNPETRVQLQKEIMPNLAVLPDETRHALQIQIRTIGEALINLQILDATLDENKPLPPRLQRQARLNRHLRNLQRIIGELADLTDLESGRHSVKAEWFEVDALIDACCVQAGRRAENKDLSFSYHIPDPVGRARTDQRLLGKILNYLLANAIQFTSEGSVNVRVDKNDDQLAIAVSDTGLGIPPERLDALFAERDENFAWTGAALGLLNTLRFAELLGGAIAIDSEVGKGSTFTLSVPATYKEDATRPVAV